MNYAPELLLIGAVASVGVLHTIVRIIGCRSR